MSWEYLTLSQAGNFLWHTSAAREWDFIDYGEMIELVKNDTFYAYIRDGQCLGIVRIKWIIQPYSGYFWFWVREDFRKTEMVREISSSLFDLMKSRIKIKRLMALCVSKSVARLCVRFGGKLECTLDDLFHKGGHAYVVYWRFD